MSQFDAKAFLDEYQEFDGDPLSYFKNLSRDMTYKSLMLKYVNRRFQTIKEEYIKDVLRRTKFNLIEADTYLNHPPNDVIMMYEKPLRSEEDAADWPVALRCEIEFFEHKTELLEYLNSAKFKKISAINEGQLFFCECCFTDDVLFEQVIACTEGHIFCADCVEKHVRFTAKEGRLELKCMFFQFCRGPFLRCLLEKIISVTEINRLLAESQLQAVKSAMIPGVEFCPLCRYAAVLEDKDTLFRCQKCREDTCRYCKIVHGDACACPEVVQERQGTSQPAVEPLVPFAPLSGIPNIGDHDNYEEEEDYSDNDSNEESWDSVSYENVEDFDEGREMEIGFWNGPGDGEEDEYNATAEGEEFADEEELAEGEEFADEEELWEEEALAEEEELWEEEALAEEEMSAEEASEVADDDMEDKEESDADNDENASEEDEYEDEDEYRGGESFEDESDDASTGRFEYFHEQGDHQENRNLMCTEPVTSTEDIDYIQGGWDAISYDGHESNEDSAGDEDGYDLDDYSGASEDDDDYDFDD